MRVEDDHCDFYLVGKSSAKHPGFGGNVIHSCLTADRNRRNKSLTGRIDRRSTIFLLLLLSGETELNPGPVTTRLMLSRLAKSSSAVSTPMTVANDAKEASLAAGPRRSYAKNISSPPAPALTCSSSPELTCVPVAEEDSPDTGEDTGEDSGEDSGSAADGVMAVDDTLVTSEDGSPQTLTDYTAAHGPPAAYTGFRGFFVQPWSLFSASPKPAKTTPSPPTWAPPSPTPGSPITWQMNNGPLSPSLKPLLPNRELDSTATTNMVIPPSSGQYLSPADSDVLFGSSGLHIIHLNVNSLSGTKLDQIREMFHDHKWVCFGRRRGSSSQPGTADPSTLITHLPVINSSPTAYKCLDFTRRDRQIVSPFYMCSLPAVCACSAC
ncbi:uncharacterized protein [Nerophis lumbriciformis]|uniref:uncharacterized protein n=1 Tax=Nerophis lumbriciformis TaxID=546530 RepID=UPI002ADF66A7|nr:uncharacterized protein LOC133618945 [Nerophis lumbriciformis]